MDLLLGRRCEQRRRHEVGPAAFHFRQDFARPERKALLVQFPLTFDSLSLFTVSYGIFWKPALIRLYKGPCPLLVGFFLSSFFNLNNLQVSDKLVVI